MGENDMDKAQRVGMIAGLLIGAGVAGLMDGIILHQILQWHHLICHAGRCEPTSIADLKHKDAQDGAFHAVMLLLVVSGLTTLYRQAGHAPSPNAGRTLTGATLLGFGLFEFFEGLIDHEILQIHHVHPGAHELAWDIGYLIFGLVVALFGWQRLSSRRAPHSVYGAVGESGATGLGAA